MYKDKFDVVKIISNTLNADPKGKLMNKYFDCEDHYNDEMITDIIESQKKYEDFERPTVAMVLDDILTNFLMWSLREISVFPKRQTFKFPSAVSLSRLQEEQKCSDIEVINPTWPLNPGTFHPLEVSFGASSTRWKSL